MERSIKWNNTIKLWLYLLYYGGENDGSKSIQVGVGKFDVTQHSNKNSHKNQLSFH